MAKNPTQLEELQNINIESEMMAFNGTKKAFRAPLSSLTNVLNAGNLKMPGSDKTIAEYYRYMSGKQMLINADFEKPINQRSQTTYPAAGNAYIIDCWNAQNAAVRLDSDGIVFEGGNGFNQSVEFPEKFLGKTITLSALVTENSAEGNFGPNTAVNAFNHSQWPAGYMSFDKNTAPGLWTITGKLPDSMPSGHTHLNFGMWFLKNERLKIRAMKLEFGDHQTLAHREGNKWVLNDPPPNYALELAKCQRYQVCYTDNIRSFSSESDLVSAREIIFYIYTPISLNKKPVAVYQNIGVLKTNGAESSIQEVSISVDFWMGNIVRIKANPIAGTPDFDTTSAYQLLHHKPNTLSKIMLDANL